MGHLLGSGRRDRRAVSLRQEDRGRRAREQECFHEELVASVRGFDAEYAFATLALFYVGARTFSDDRAHAVAADGIEASVLAGGITQILKFSVGRDRPGDNRGSERFLPFHFSTIGKSYNSFPSGHATEAFAVASVIASHYENLWIESTAYGVAGLVGWSRLHDNAHFASDVVAGAAIGTWVGRTIVRRHA